MKLSDYCMEQLRGAIASLRHTCDSAEYALQRENRTPEELIAAVNHEFMWGLANASMGLESALAECSRERQRREAGI